MTLNFIQPLPPQGYTYSIPFSVNVPNLPIGTALLVLKSDYTQQGFSFQAYVVISNDRYSELLITYSDFYGNGDYAGFYQATFQNLSGLSVIELGLTKFVNNKSESLQNQPAYPLPDDNGQGYVIF